MAGNMGELKDNPQIVTDGASQKALRFAFQLMARQLRMKGIPRIPESGMKMQMRVIVSSIFDTGHECPELEVNRQKKRI